MIETHYDITLIAVSEVKRSTVVKLSDVSPRFLIPNIVRYMPREISVLLSIRGQAVLS